MALKILRLSHNATVKLIRHRGKLILRSLSTSLTHLIWLSILPLVLLATWMAVDRVQNQQAIMANSASDQAQNFAVSINRYLEFRANALNILALSPLLDDQSRWPELYAEAKGYQASFDSHVILADTGEPKHMLFNTRVPFGTPLPLLPVPKGHSAVTRALSTGRPAVGDTFMGPIAKEPLVAIAIPALREGKINHLLLTIFSTRQIQQRIEQVKLPSGWALTLSDGRGDTIASQTPAGFDTIRDVDKEWRFAEKLSFAPWSVTLEIPRTIQQELLLKSTATLVLVIMMATLVGYLSATRIARRLSLQMASLATAETDKTPVDIAEIAAVQKRLDSNLLKLKASEEMYRLIIMASIDGFWLIDMQGNLLEVNDIYCQLSGYTRAELLNTNVSNLEVVKTSIETRKHYIKIKEQGGIILKQGIAARMAHFLM